jgi:histone deacetylase 6
MTRASLIDVPSECKMRISGVVNFVTGTLRPVKSDVDDNLSTWYKANSRVYVASDHACWADPDLARKVLKKRFGTVVRSPMIGLNRMMSEHAREAQQWILSRVADQGETTEEEKMA